MIFNFDIIWQISQKIRQIIQIYQNLPTQLQFEKKKTLIDYIK